MSRLIVCIHATPRAIGPAQRMLRDRPGEFRSEDLVEEKLLACGGDDQASFALLLEMLKRAEARRPAAVLTTCSMYTRHLPAARRHVSVPVLGIDEPMIERAAATGGRLALVGSLPTSIALTEELILRRAKIVNAGTSVVRRHEVPVDACETPEGTRRLAEEVRELGREVDAVVVVQLSLSPVADFLKSDEHDRILTSARTALARLRTIVEDAQP